MREIVLDTETTGLRPDQGDRVIELGCLELMNGLPTGEHFITLINPERDIPEDSQRIHGIDNEKVRDQPVFSQIVEQFINFIGDAPLVIHNAEFDMRFLNAELARLGFPPLPMSRAIDTVQIARRKFPGEQASLDALCRRFRIDNSARTKHDALGDCRLLAEVYIHLQGGRQAGLGLSVAELASETERVERIARIPRPHAPSEAELAAHAIFIAAIKDAIWLRD